MNIQNRLISRGGIAIALFALSLLAMWFINGVTVQNTVPYIQKAADRATDLPDTLLYYDDDRLYAILDSLGTAGREAYGSFLLTFDAGFPLLYSCALALSSWTLLLRAAPRHAWKLSLLPLLAGLFDYLENASMLVLLYSYPERLNGLASLAGCFTLVKWGMTLISAAILIMAIAGFWVKRNPQDVPRQRG